MTRKKWITTALIPIALCALSVLLSLTGNFATGSGTTVSTAPLISPTLPPTATSIGGVPTRTPSATHTVSDVAERTPDPTPTIPSATSTPSVTPLPTSTPAPLSPLAPGLIQVTPPVSDTTPVPTPVPIAQTHPDAINIVVLGSDRRPDWDDWHTDVIQVVSIQPAIPAVTILSIPRDLYVFIPGFWMSRINFADMYGELYSYEGGGPALIKQTLLYNLGIPVHYYVRTDFNGFVGIVDTLDGVDIPVHCRLQDHWPYPDENGEYPIKTLEPGVHHMDGETALWYARSRMTSSVFARERRQQQVLEALWRKSRSKEILPHAPQLWSQSRSMVVTDMSLPDALRLAEVAFRLDAQNVRFRNIGRQHVIPWTTPKGGAVFLPNWEEIEPVVTEALGPVPEGRLWRTLQTVEVWNGTPNADWDQLAADRLFREGFVAVIGEPDRRDYPQTQLIDFTAASKGGAASQLQRMFGVSPENLIVTTDPNAGVQYRLIIGADYQTCPGY